jgi:hypothetical protein
MKKLYLTKAGLTIRTEIAIADGYMRAYNFFMGHGECSSLQWSVFFFTFAAGLEDILT